VGVVLAVALAALIVLGVSTEAARASSEQQAMLQDDAALRANPSATLARLRLLGVGWVRVFVMWDSIAPRPKSPRRPRGFVAADPASYLSRSWSFYDMLVRDAAADGLRVNFTLTGPPPLWAAGAGAPSGQPHPQWRPSSHEFASFVRAVATRYSGDYDPSTGLSIPSLPTDLPRVDFWAIWNEPNYGPDLAPQAIDHSKVEVAPALYRNLVDAAWTALHATGHGSDTFLFGEIAPRGADGPSSRHAPQGWPGNFSGTKPLRFLRALYCVDSNYRPRRGSAAARRACPTTAAASRGFRAAHPALFQASGFSDHPYSQSSPPDVEARPDPSYTSLAEIPRLERVLDRLQTAYGSTVHLPVYMTEYGYITRPPKRLQRYLSASTAAYYLNWAEYLTWSDPRIRTLEQYLLFDPAPASINYDYGGFASGLLLHDGTPKVTYDAYRLPLYLPVTSTRAGHSLEVWGCVRPAHFATLDAGGAAQQAEIQFRRDSQGRFRTVRTVSITNPQGYFDVRQAFPATGAIRLRWVYPDGAIVHSRVVSISVSTSSVGDPSK
jgi:hypothetical protein